MRPLIISRIIFFLLASLLIHANSFAQRAYIDISAPEARKILFAVPWFENSDLDNVKQQYGRNLSRTLTKSLEFHGVIEVIDPEKYRGSDGAEWKSLGADFAVIGQYAIAKDMIKMEMRLLDVSAGDMLMGKSYQGPSTQTSEMIYKFVDAVIEELTGKPGIASTQIAFVSQPADKREKEIFITDILGNKLRQVTRHQNLVVSPRFSPDGIYLAYSSYHSGNQNLYITDLRQTKTTRAISKRKGMNLAPAWSPDGENLVLTLSKNGNPDLFLINRSGEIIKQLTDNAGINVSPAYSPDGKYIVFVSDRSRKPQLYLMELATAKVRRLTYEGSENAEPAWSPKENLVVYSSLRDGIYQLCTINPFQENSSIQITKDQTHHESPSWAPDGNQIIFAKRDGAGHKIYGIMKNGNFQRMLFSFPGSQTYPRWTVKYNDK
jgi:TolB protein